MRDVTEIPPLNIDEWRDRQYHAGALTQAMDCCYRVESKATTSGRTYSVIFRRDQPALTSMDRVQIETCRLIVGVSLARAGQVAFMHACIMQAIHEGLLPNAALNSDRLPQWEMESIK